MCWWGRSNDNKQAHKANTSKSKTSYDVDPSHKVLWVRLMRLVRNEADVARDATKAYLRQVQIPPLPIGGRIGGALPANYSIVKYHRPTYSIYTI